MQTNVNPERLTKFDRTQDELLRFLFFSVAVAGKTAKQIAIKVNAVLRGIEDAEGYLGRLLSEERLLEVLERERMGKYRTLLGFVEDYFRNKLDLSTCSVEDLEKLHGVGPKTARMFMLHSRPDQRFAVLDTHVLKFLAEKKPGLSIPRATPSGKKYAELEKEWLDLMQYYEDCWYIFGSRRVTCSKGLIPLKMKAGSLDLAAFDLDLWRLYSGNKDDYAG